MPFGLLPIFARQTTLHIRTRHLRKLAQDGEEEKERWIETLLKVLKVYFGVITPNQSIDSRPFATLKP